MEIVCFVLVLDMNTWRKFHKFNFENFLSIFDLQKLFLYRCRCIHRYCFISRCRCCIHQYCFTSRCRWFTKTYRYSSSCYESSLVHSRILSVFLIIYWSLADWMFLFSSSITTHLSNIFQSHVKLWTTIKQSHWEGIHSVCNMFSILL